MNLQTFYRIHIRFLEPGMIAQELRNRFQREITNNMIYLGIRLNPTNFNRSAAMNTFELAKRCQILAQNILKEQYGNIDLQIKEYPWSTDIMKSIIDTDSRTLVSLIQNQKNSINNIQKKRQNPIYSVKNT